MKYPAMNRPSNIVKDSDLWVVHGHSDVYGSGVLVWCYDKDDAEYQYNMMKDDPDFITLGYEKFL